MKRSGNEGNICADLGGLSCGKPSVSDAALAQLMCETFGQDFSALWEERRREIARGYAALLCRALESSPAGIRTDAGSRREKQ